ncbi:MAG: GNAT family N-acetyltransferase [Anaerovoracaceae bacterium]
MKSNKNMEKTGEVGVTVRSARPEDFDRILQLNEESVHFLSPLTREKLEHLHSQAELHKVAVMKGEILAFCLAFREGADYDSVNYLWFTDHYPSFLYVDRVVVDLGKQSLGLGSLLYEEVFRHARETGVPLVTAEIDIEPPNPVSLKFHEKFGFHEVGRQEVANGKKVVSLQIARP